MRNRARRPWQRGSLSVFRQTINVHLGPFGRVFLLPLEAIVFLTGLLSTIGAARGTPFLANEDNTLDSDGWTKLSKLHQAAITNQPGINRIMFILVRWKKAEGGSTSGEKILLSETVAVNKGMETMMIYLGTDYFLSKHKQCSTAIKSPTSIQLREVLHGEKIVLSEHWQGGWLFLMASGKCFQSMIQSVALAIVESFLFLVKFLPELNDLFIFQLCTSSKIRDTIWLNGWLWLSLS